MQTMTHATASKINETFNRLYKIGDPIIAVTIDGKIVQTTIRRTVFFSNKDMMIGTESKPGVCKLDHVIPIPQALTTDQIHQERIATWNLCAGVTCEHKNRDDGTCLHHNSTTPECHEWACPLLKTTAS